MRKCLFVIITFLFSLSCAAAKKIVIGDLKYEVQGEKTKKYFENAVFVSDGKKAVGKVIIPEKISVDGIEYYVNGIKEGAFKKNSKLTEISLPSTLWVVDYNSFKNCDNLRKVEFRDNDIYRSDMLRLGWNSFTNCGNLREVVFPNKLLDIWGSYHVERNHLKSILKMPFENCFNLEKVVLSDTVFYDESGFEYFAKVFKNCKRLKSVSCYNKNPAFVALMFDQDCPWYIQTYPQIKSMTDEQYLAYIGGTQPIKEIAQAQKENTILCQQGTGNEVTRKTSDIDMNIPVSSKKRENTFAIVISNENYKREEKVDYALNDGEVLCKYLTKTLGINSKNIMYLPDATLNDMNYALDWVEQVGNAYDGDISLILYYSGHGFPSESSQKAYLLPVDGFGNNSNTAYSLENLYRKLESIPSKQTVVFLDCCFSGTQKNEKMMASSRGVRIKPKESVINGNLVVIAASSNDETAYCMDEQNHGLFTYFLLKKMQECNGNTNFGDLVDYVNKQVRRYSIVNFQKNQTPNVQHSPTIHDWKTMTF